MAKVVVERISERKKTLKRIFDHFHLSIEGKDVYIKINTVDFRKGCYTSPQMLSAALDVLYDLGAD